MDAGTIQETERTIYQLKKLVESALFIADRIYRDAEAAESDFARLLADFERLKSRLDAAEGDSSLSNPR